jgi:Tol biopolymer transport system component
VDTDIWRIDLVGSGAAAGPAQRWLASTRSELNPQFSRDGKRVAFPSDRGGYREIWIAGADRTNPLPVTSMRASMIGGPSWSPDGSHIAFDSTLEGQFEVYVVSAAGGTPRRLTDHPATDGVPSYSRDGGWIYFASNRSGMFQVWKIPAAGGQAVQVTRKGGWVGMESPDGQWLYYSKSSSSADGLWKISTSGGEETEILPSVTHMNFSVTAGGIYFIPRAGPDGRHAIHFHSFATGKSVLVAELSGGLSNGLTVSPDGRVILYSQTGRVGSDLMLVENFR